MDRELVPFCASLIALFLFGVSAFVFYVTGAPSPPPPKRQRTVDEYNADALLMAARKHYVDMQTELRKSELEAARIEALHKEREEIIAHDQKVRRLNQTREEKRKAS